MGWGGSAHVPSAGGPVSQPGFTVALPARGPATAVDPPRSKELNPRVRKEESPAPHQPALPPMVTAGPTQRQDLDLLPIVICSRKKRIISD